MGFFIGLLVGFFTGAISATLILWWILMISNIRLEIIARYEGDETDEHKEGEAEARM